MTDRSAAGLSAQAALAEHLGYGSFWLPESHFGTHAIPDPLMLLAAVAAGTGRIRLGTTSFLLPLRNPLQAAEQVAVLDQLSGGRVILGVGRGFSPPMLRAFNVDPREKRALFETGLSAMVRAWSGEPVDSGGDGGAVHLDPLPVQRPHPPIWVAAFGPKALAQAGRLGLPYLASPVETLDTLADNYVRHAAAADASGLPRPVDVPVMRTLYITDDPREARELRQRLQTEMEGSGRLPPGTAAEDWCLIGPPAQIQDQVMAYRERLGMTHLIVTRLRIGGVERSRLQASAIRAAELLLD